MTTVLAVDGGQTGTRALVASADGECLGVGLAGSSLHDEEVRLAIRQALRTTAAGRLDCVLLGLTAAGISSDGDEHYRELAIQETTCTRTIIEMDCVTALMGAAAGREGIVVIAGGGSIGFGVGSDGRRARAGGFGPILGDPGSAYAIGLEAVRTSMSVEDGLEGPTVLSELLRQRFQVPRARDIKALLHARHIGVQEIADLGELVGIAARRGDQAAQRILSGAGRDLADLAIAVAGRLGELPAGLAVYPVGGVFTDRQFVGRAFRRRLRPRVPSLPVGRAHYPPIIGAVIAGFQAIGEPLDAETIGRLDQQWRIALSQRTARDA